MPCRSDIVLRAGVCGLARADSFASRSWEVKCASCVVRVTRSNTHSCTWAIISRTSIHRDGLLMSRLGALEKFSLR